MNARRLAIAITACLAALSLIGCNGPAMDRPMIEAREDARVLLKPGIWSHEYPCPRGKRSAHPLCGVPMPDLVVTQHELRPILAPNLPAEMRGELNAMTARYVIAYDDPMLVQVQIEGPGPSGRITGEFDFAALEPTERDSAGNIIAAVAWPVLCGPPPAPGDWNYGMQNEESTATNHPFDGMKMDGVQCSVRDANALKAAAKASRALTDVIVLKYVRNGG